MFEHLTTEHHILIYQGLKGQIDNCVDPHRCRGFHNSDMGHDVYLMGADGFHSDHLKDVDSPDKSELFQMLSELSETLYSDYNGTDWFFDFRKWDSYCCYAIKHSRQMMARLKEDPSIIAVEGLKNRIVELS